MSPTYDVMVIGGGIVGLCAALAMCQRGFSVALIDAGALTADIGTTDSRVYAINNASQHLFQTLGVWDYLDSTRVSPYTHMHVWDSLNHTHIDFDARMLGVDRLGTIIEESVIKQALLQHVFKLNIDTFPLCRVGVVQTTAEGVLIKDGTHKWQAKLMIIADGAASVTRQLLGVPLTSWPYHQQALVTMVQTEKSHQRTAYQVFNQDGPLAFLPLADLHHCSIVWSTTAAHAQRLLDFQEDQFSEHITRAFATKLGACKVVGARHQFPLHMRHAKRYTGNHWLLMGDAAHTIHPLAGLGLNVGLADLAAWIAKLDSNPSGNWSINMLNAYQRERKHQVWQMIALMEGLKTIFSNPLPPVSILRGLGVWICNNTPPLKRMLIEHAAGR